MIAQYRVELRRLLHRQVLFVFGIFAVIALVLTGLGIWVASGPADQYRGNVSFDPVSGSYIENPVSETVERTFCPTGLVTSARPDADDDPFAQDPVRCPEVTPTTIDRHEAVAGVPAAYHPWNGSISYFTLAVLVLLWLVAASLVGEEFRHGTVETAVVAEPRRARLLTVRLAAVATVGVAVYLVALGGFLAANAPAWATRGVEGATVSASAILASAGRGSLAAFLIVVLAASLAVIGRGSLLAVGVLVGLGLVAGVLFLVLHPLVPVEFFTNLHGLVTGGDGIRVYRVGQSLDGGPAVGPTITVNGAGWPWGATFAVVAGYAIAALGGAYVLFTRRDIR